MSSNSINSISEFLLHAGTEYIVFDIGRGITPVPSQTFLEIENGTRVAPFPRQQHAWFGVVFWNKNASNQHYIWFIKLPIDEQGLLIAAARNHFLQIIIDALGASIADDKETASTLPDNPYSFVPTQSQLAQFNALVRLQLALPMSDSAQQALAYIKAPQVVDWQKIPLQGIADIASRLQTRSLSQEIESHIIENFRLFSDTFKQTLMDMSEAIEVSEHMQQCFISELNSSQEINLAALRALSSAQKNDAVYKVLHDFFEANKMNRLDILSVIAARHFQQMDAPLLLQFFESVAEVDHCEGYDGQLFIGFFSDLVQVPQLRKMVLDTLRAPSRSDRLAAAIGKLFSQTKG